MHTKTWRRATATSIAALTTLALAIPATAGAARPDTYAGTADALTLDLRLTGPVEIMGRLTEDGGATLRQTIASSSATLRSHGTDAVVARLGKGPLAPFDVSASSQREDSGRTELGSIQEGPLTAEGGVLRWEIVDDTLSWSSSELAMLRVSLAPVLAELPEDAAAPLQDAVRQATDSVNGIVSELNGTLGELEGQINQIEDRAPIDLPDILPSELPLVPDVTTVDLLTARKLWSDTRVETIDGVVRSTAQSGAAELTLLGGVIRVPALQYTSVAEAGGEAGTATADTVVETVVVEIGDYRVGISGTVLTVGDVSVDLADPDLEGIPADEALAEIKALLQDLINSGGLSIEQGTGTTEVDDAGESASATTTAFALRLRPLNADVAAAEVLDLNLQLMQTAAAVQAVPIETQSERPALPRTGGGAAAGLVGLIGMAGAFALRRRS